MSIKYSEISDSGISESDFNKIFSATGGHTKSIQIYRQNPKFTLHSNPSIDKDAIWDVASNDDFIVIFYHSNATTIRFMYLAKEDDDNPGSLNSWVDNAWNTCDANSPLCVTTDGTWFYIYYFSGGLLQKGKTNTVASAGLASPSTYSFEGVAWLDVAEDAFGSTIYAVTIDDQSNHKVNLVQDTYVEDLGIVWPEEMTGFSIYSFSEGSDDTTSSFSNTDIRHCLSFSAALPKLYSEKLVDGAPHEVAINTGGVISYVIRPRNGSRNPQVSYYSDIQAFDEVSEVQYRRTVKLSSANNLLWAASVGQNGDLNGTDPTFGFEGLYFYSSADGKNWSQDQIIPIDDIVLDFTQYDRGVQIVVLGNYVYTIANNVVLRSLGCGLFGNVHPTLSLDVTNKVNSFSTTASDFRQTTLNLDNEDGYFYGTFLMNPGRYRMITKIGAYVKGTNYLFQTSLEDIDTIEDPRERPRQLRVTSRDAMALMTDRTASVDAIQYDNITIGKDTFDPIGSATDSGLSHSDVVSGTWGTTDKAVTGATFNTLYCKSKFVNSVSFSTFKTLVADGHAVSVFNIPNPTLHVDTPTFANAPTYAGAVFRGLDKDNYWFARYNYWTEAIELGERRSGDDIVYTSYGPSDTFIANAANGNYVGILVEFNAAQIRVWACEDFVSVAQYDFIFEYTTRADSGTISAIYQGYTGVLACGYSDADVEEPEPEPTIVTTDSRFTDDVPARLVVHDTAGKFWRVRNIHNGSPVFEDITPPSLMGPWDFDHWDSKRVVTTVSGIYYIEAWECNDIWASTPVWSRIWRIDDTQITSTNAVMRSSINRQGYWIWGGYGGGVYFYFHTFDNFATYHWPSDRFAFSANSRPMISLGGYNTNERGYVYITEGQWNNADGHTDRTGIWRSRDWGATFELLHPHVSNGVGDYADGIVDFAVWGGGINVPHTLPGGAPNSDMDKFLWSDLSNGVMANEENGVWFTNLPQPQRPYGQGSEFGYPRHLINTLTVDGGYVNCAMGDGQIFVTSTAGKHWDIKTVPTGGYHEQFGVSGFPNNPDWLAYWSGGHIFLTKDRFDTYIDLTGPYLTAGGNAVQEVAADLSTWFTSPTI